MEDVGELLADQVFLLFIKDVDLLLCVIEPGMVKNLLCTQPFGYIFLEHILHEISGQLRHRVAILYLLLVELVGQVPNLISLEWHISIENSVQTNACRPDVNRESLIAYFLNDFRSNISGCTALFE